MFQRNQRRIWSLKSEVVAEFRSRTKIIKNIHNDKSEYEFMVDDNQASSQNLGLEACPNIGPFIPSVI